MQFSQQETVRFSRRNTLSGMLVFLLDATLFGVFGYFALTSSSLGVQALCAIVTGVMIALLFIVGHDAAHQSLTPSKRLNGVIGRLALLPSLHPFSLWQLGHNQTHHRWTNLHTHDYVWRPLSRHEYDSRSRLGQWTYRLHRSILGPFTYYFFDIWMLRMVLPSRKVVHGKYKTEYIFDLAFVWTLITAYLVFLVLGGLNGLFQEAAAPLNALLFGFLIPFVVWNFLMAFVVYLHHTHPLIRWYDDMDTWRRDASQSLSTVHVTFPWPINFLFHRIMEHNAHHVRPSIPLYRLKEAQETLDDDHIEVKWTPFSHLDIVRRCKLFDFEACRWTDFAGNFTSPPLAPSQQTSAAPIPAPHYSKDSVSRRSAHEA